MRTGPKPRPIADRLWAKVTKGGPNDCWLWTGSCNSRNGYGHISAGGKYGAKILAHRVAYEVTYGPTPLWVLHRCDVKRCCNPLHLFTGNRRANTDDMLSKNRQAFGVRQGHARLDDKAVVAIHADLSSGLLHREIAKQYNVARTTISAINVKRTWKHV